MEIEKIIIAVAEVIVDLNRSNECLRYEIDSVRHKNEEITAQHDKLRHDYIKLLEEASTK